MKGAQDDLEAAKRRIAAAVADWEGASLASIRESFVRLFEEPPRAIVESFDISGMQAAWIAAPESFTDRVILYCHGGGYQIGSIRSHTGLMSRLAVAARARVLGFDYRLAPEHRCPAAAEDAFAAYAWLLDQGMPSSSIAVAGDSAGGALALIVALRARDAGLPQPAALALISPWLDLALRGESYRSRAALDNFSKPEQLAAMARTYLGRGRGRDPSDPSLSPLDADLSALPPILIHAGDHDITFDDALLLALLARARGVDAELRVWEGMFHHFQMFSGLRQSRESLTELGRFIATHAGRG